MSNFFFAFTIPFTLDIKIIRVLLHHCMIFFQRKVFVKKTQIFYSTLENHLPWIFHFINTSNSFCIWFTDKLSFFSTIYFYKKPILSMLISKLKFTNESLLGRYLKKLCFQRPIFFFDFRLFLFIFFKNFSLKWLVR